MKLENSEEEALLKANDVLTEILKRNSSVVILKASESIRKILTDNAKLKYKPHCWGKMRWILKYPSGMEPRESICNCEHGSLKCKLLTRNNNRINK